MHVFFDKRWNFLEKYNEFVIKLAILQKKINSRHVHNKKYLKVEKKEKQKKDFNVFLYQ